MACRFLECLPVSQCRAKIKNICNIPSMAVPPNTAALQLLKRLYDQKFELEVEFFDADCSIIDLLDNSVDPPSLMTRMLPMMFTAAAVELQPAQNLPAVVEAEPEPKTEKNVIELPPLPPSPPSSPVQSVEKKKRNGRHYFGDLQHIPISISEQSKYILVLNCIGLYKTGYITACYFDNEETAEGFQNLLNIVNEYGSSDAVLPGYVPEYLKSLLICISSNQIVFPLTALENYALHSLLKTIHGTAAFAWRSTIRVLIFCILTSETRRMYRWRESNRFQRRHFMPFMPQNVT